MPSIRIVITQNAVSGAANESRDDIVTGALVALTNLDNTGVTSFQWEFVSTPIGSGSVMAGATTDAASFTPDVVGTYLIQLTLDGRIKGRVLAAVKTVEGIRPPADEEADEFDGWQAAVRKNTNILRITSSANAAEIEAARQSDVFSPTGGFGGGTFGDLDLRIEANDGHSRTIISCTDGVLSAGGMYSGMDALQRALLDLGAGGGTILVRGGEYHITVPITIDKPIKIIGVEARPTIVNEVAGFMLTFEHDAYGSRVQNVEIINFGAGTYQAFESNCNDFLVKQCEIEGTIYIKSGRRARVEQTRISPVGKDCITIGSGAVLTEISQCELAPIGEGLKLLNHNGSGCNVSNTFFIDGYGSQAIVDTATSTALKIKSCTVRCEPYKRDRQVILLAGRRTEIDGLYMLTWGPGNISTSLLCVSEAPTFRGKNIRINLQENMIGDISGGASGPNNPVAIVSADAILDGFTMDGGMVPSSGDGWTLDEDYPLIQLTGIPNFGVVGSPTQLTKGRVKLMNATISAPYHSTSGGQLDVVLIGDLGQGNGMASTPNGFFELENVNIDGYRCAVWTPASDTKHMVSNIQFGSKIHGCSFTDGANSGWNTIINCVDVYDVQITDNSFSLLGLQTCENIILGKTIGLGIRGMIVNNNNIQFTDLSTVGAYQGAVTLLGATNCSICNNVIYNIHNVGSGIYLVNLFVGTSDCIVTGNTIHTGDGGAANYPIADLSWAGPPGFPNPPPANLWSNLYSVMEPALAAGLIVPPPPASLVTFLGPIAYDLNIVD